MGQKGRDRSQRRREFDDVEDAGFLAYDGRSRQPSRTGPRESAVPSGPAIDAIVKWFNVQKGFGFVELADGSGDAFLHAAVLEAALGLAASTSAAPHANARSTGKASSCWKRPDPATAISTEGTVKRFNADKGFGFVACEDGEKDVFVHASIVERAGLRGLEEGQRLALKVVRTQKGREAISLSLI
jgi:cold shock protein